MQYEKLVPSIDLCEEMARLGICQDEPELWWNDDVLGDDGREIVCDNPYDHCPNNQRKK